MNAKLGVRGLPVEIKTHHKQVQIYRPDPEKVGFGADLFRDCIDVCVKLAFGFNALADHVPLDLRKVSEHEVVVSISNLDDIDTKIFKSPYSVRVKQSSDVRVVKTFTAIERMLYKEGKMMEKAKEEDASWLSYVVIDTLSRAFDKSCFGELHSHVQVAASKIIAYVDDTEISTLLGELS